MSASKNLGKVFMTPKGIWDKNSNYTKLDIVTNKIGKISCGYIATTDIEKNIEITDNRWLKLFELLDGDLTEEYKAVQTDVANKATDVDANKKAVDLIYSQMQKLYDVEISTTTPTNERTGLWINPDDISGVINIPEIKDDEVSDVDTWSSKKIDNVTDSLKEDLSNIIQDQYEILINKRMNVILGEFEKGSINADGSNQDLGAGNLLRTKKYIKLYPVPYTFKTINGNGLAIFIYDSNGIFLRAEFMAATMGERSRTITFLETDYKCRIVINSYNNDYENYPVKAENIESIIIDISATKKSKTICCIGDSFTASTNSWHTYIRNRMGYNMINLGVAGTRISVSYVSGSKKYTSFIERVENGVLDAYTPNLIIVFGGINDTVKLHNAQMTIGTINDSAEYSPTKTSGYSFIGRVKYLIELIKSKKPGVPILGVIPPNYSDGTSNFEWWSEDIAQIQSALRLVYEFYGIPYVDIKKNCQEMYEDSYNLATYRIDGRSNMHPSDKGYEAISVRIQKDGIENILIN